MHVSKFWASIKLCDAAIGDGGGNSTSDGFCRIDATTKEILYVGGINAPSNRASNLLHTSPGNLSKTTAINIALGIFSSGSTSRTIDARKVKILIIATSHINGHIMGFRISISVAPIGEILEPCISSYKKVWSKIRCISIL